MYSNCRHSSLFFFLLLIFNISKAIGQDVPNYEVVTTKGDTFELYDPISEGKVLMTFLFHFNCNRCDWAIQHLVDQYKLGRADDGCFEILALDVSGASSQDINSYASQQNALFPFGSVSDNNWISSYLATNFGVGRFDAPGILIYDTNGIEISKGNGDQIFSPFPFDGLIQSATDLECFDIGEVEVETSVETVYGSSFIEFLQRDRKRFSLAVPQIGSYEIRIYNLAGSMVFQSKKDLNSSATVFSTEMTNGVYFVLLGKEEKTWSTKIYWNN